MIGEIGAIIGKGLIAGLAGTVAISISQAIERKITKRESDHHPAKAVEMLFDIGPEPGKEEALAHEVHYTYGSLWGTARGLLSACGIRGFTATAIHFTAIWGTALTIESKLDLEPKVKDRDKKDLAVSALHHAIYALVAGWVYDAID